MSESIDKLTAIWGRQPTQRRQRPRQAKKAAPKKANVNSQQPIASTPEATALARVNNHISPPAIPTGGRRPRSGVLMPTAVKPMPTAKGKIPPLQPSTKKFKTVRVQKQAMPSIDRRSRKTRLKPMARTLLYGLRLLIVGVGMGAIVGTLLSVLDPANRVTPPASLLSNTNQSPSPANPNPSVGASGLYLSQEMMPLKTAVQNLAAANPNLTPGVFLVDLDTGSYIDVNGTTSFPAASTIKIPILIAFFQDVDTGKIRLDEMLTMQQNMIAGGSGNLQYKPALTQYSALEVATKMITISDNTATNMLIARLGGMEALNERFRTWGLASTAIRNQLPDLPGTNTTSPRELGNLMAMVNQGNFVSMRSRDLMLDIMRRTERDNLLPSGLGAGARTYHKTGDIGTMLADVGLVDIPTGKRYIAAIMVRRPNNDPRAEKLISSISRVTYQQLSQNPVAPSSPTSTVPATGYQAPVMSPALPNGTMNTMPLTGYPPPVISPVLPNGTMNTMPLTGYPPPVISPQYYPPR
ncbi:beta-lactamase class A [Cylindrospermum stagnale PCC 7417]|uniref:Beta-lactamase class A n=1 Tax=Cylindrospermum stagnale PCC 7417 TaxID=56107 RepID=K9WQQ4_9NOST|nr:serine hydrolase [Cylindrospermum stagnale]AFZ22518.1 beta-lactamase class A [Cylindrospermum stagnale PCC 7417]